MLGLVLVLVLMVEKEAKRSGGQASEEQKQSQSSDYTTPEYGQSVILMLRPAAATLLSSLILSYPLLFELPDQHQHQHRIRMALSPLLSSFSFVCPPPPL